MRKEGLTLKKFGLRGARQFDLLPLFTSHTVSYIPVNNKSAAYLARAWEIESTGKAKTLKHYEENLADSWHTLFNFPKTALEGEFQHDKPARASLPKLSEHMTRKQKQKHRHQWKLEHRGGPGKELHHSDIR